MNRTPLLILSLILNAALLAVIGWLVRGEPSGLFPSAEAGLESKYPQTIVTTASRATIEHGEQADPARFEVTPANESGAASLARAGLGTERAVDRVAQARHRGSPTVEAESSAGAKAERWTDQTRLSTPLRSVPGRASIRNAVQRETTFSAMGTGRAPAGENARGRQADRPNASVAKDTSHEQPGNPANRSEAVSISSAETVSISSPKNPSPIEWPTGPYTAEEQAYRQQYGWATFAAALQERELAQGAEY